MNEKVTLITGITGLLGTALVGGSKVKRRLRGIYIGDYMMPGTDSVTYAPCDVTDAASLFRNFQADKIDCIIHTAGLADTDACQKDPEGAYTSNVIGTKNVIDLAKSKDAKLVYISTNAVFDGQNAPYSEGDKPNPINQYGKVKLECENFIKEELEDYLIVRPILMYGLNNPNERKSFFIWVLEKLRNNQEIYMVNDVFENPLLSYQCADIIWCLIDRDSRGIYHVAGDDILNRYDAARTIAKVFSFDETLINAVNSDFFKTIAPRPKDTSYVTKKIEKELNVKPIGFREGLLMLKERM